MSEPKRILIVDDDPHVREIASLYLKKDGHVVFFATDGEAALKEAADRRPDLVVLDLMLPKKDGLEVCRELRARSSVPIIMLTARSEDADRIVGLEIGADDYVTKPFNPRELSARVKAVLRRAAPGQARAGECLEFPGLSVDITGYQVVANGHALALTPKEVEVLHTLASSPGRVFTRENLLQTVWGYDFFGDARTVDTHVKRLRQKLAAAAAEEGRPWRIATVWGVGYKFECGPPPPPGAERDGA
jgi:two-component system response regulator ResD